MSHECSLKKKKIFKVTDLRTSSCITKATHTHTPHWVDHSQTDKKQKENLDSHRRGKRHYKQRNNYKNSNGLLSTDQAN